MSGRHIFEPSRADAQPRKRQGRRHRRRRPGPGAARASIREILDDDYLLQIAAPRRRPSCPSWRREFIQPYFDVDHEALRRHDRRLPRHPRPRGAAARRVALLRARQARGRWTHFIAEQRPGVPRPRRGGRRVRLPEHLQPQPGATTRSLGEKQAFVLSHGRNMMILKIVGYAEQVVQYYKLEDFNAHVWIAHQRYPDQGPRLAPGGAHPFIGLDEALVHNGDFANYHSVVRVPAAAQHLPAVPHRHRGLGAALRPAEPASTGIPLEYIIEALAPDHGAGLRPAARGEAADLPADPGDAHPRLARRPVVLHHRPQPRRTSKQFQLIGITDTAMLRPQVFALQKGEVQIGLICSEKQAIDATLQSLAKRRPALLARGRPLLERPRRQLHRRRRLHLHRRTTDTAGKMLTCTDKFGRPGRCCRRTRAAAICRRTTPPPAMPTEDHAGDRRRVVAAAAAQAALQPHARAACRTGTPTSSAACLRRPRRRGRGQRTTLQGPAIEAPHPAHRPPLRHRRQAARSRPADGRGRARSRSSTARP
ncbi:MAG: hypothetical protein MZW92_06560 [Comamonadaceae bacterium]|nr:hypothetical protein [Comamonadaceae bacterium]